MVYENRFNSDDFKGYLEGLVKDESFANAKEEGIAKLVIDKGYSLLSDKQKYVFERSMIGNYYDNCQRCGLEVPWSEMSGAMFNGGYCSWCWKVALDNRA